MAKPVILTVDDEAEALSAIERDLRQHFSADYRILSAPSGTEALQAVRELKKRNTALLTAYSDTQAAITTINQLSLDYYLMKPWDPPERLLYPVLEDLLSDWSDGNQPPFEGIRVLGTLWSGKSHDVKDFLTRNQIPYLWLDVEKAKEAQALLQALTGQPRLPVIAFPDGSVLSDPDLPTLAHKVGLQTKPARPFYDFIIIGGGPAGLASAVYGASEGLRTVLIEKEATGGQAGTSALTEDYLGLPKGLSGSDLARRATTQAKRFGVEILIAEAVGVRVEDPYRYVRLSDGIELSSHALLIATGVSVRKLEVPGVEQLTGAGVYYGAALTEAVHYQGQDVVVVGGANSAGQGAVFLSRFAKTVYLVIRGESLDSGLSAYLVDQVTATKNIRVLNRREVGEVRGNPRLESVLLTHRDSGEVQELAAAAMFVFIGATAHTDLVDGVVQRDSAGFILTGRDLLSDGKRPKGWALKRDPILLKTSVPEIFSTGDVRHMSFKRVGAAVGDGSVVVALVHQHLESV